jgi:PAS domain S-box-containing protein
MNIPEENKHPCTVDSSIAGEIAYTHDLSGNITFLNHAGERITGYSCDEVCRMNITQLLAPEISDLFSAEMMRNVSEGVGSVYEIEMVAKNGQRVPLEVSTELVMQGGVPAQIRGFAVCAIVGSRSGEKSNRRCLDQEFFFG